RCPRCQGRSSRWSAQLGRNRNRSDAFIREQVEFDGGDQASVREFPSVPPFREEVRIRIASIDSMGGGRAGESRRGILARASQRRIHDDRSNRKSEKRRSEPAQIQ